MEVIRSFPYNLRSGEVDENANFALKKGILSSENILWPTFSRIIEDQKPQRINLKGPQGFLKNIVQIMT